MIDDRLMWYKSNFNEVAYSIILKIEYSDPVLESIKDDIMEWKTIIVALKPKN